MGDEVRGGHRGKHVQMTWEGCSLRVTLKCDTLGMTCDGDIWGEQVADDVRGVTFGGTLGMTFDGWH